MNNENNTATAATVAPVKKQGIKVSGVLGLMKIGYTRTPESANYNAEIGSVQAHYGLSDYEVKQLFKVQALKNAKTSVAEPINFFIEDEDAEPEVVVGTATIAEPAIAVEEVVEANSSAGVGAPGVSADGVVIEKEVVEEVAEEVVVEEAEEVVVEEATAEASTSLSFSQEDLGMEVAKEVAPAGPFQ